MKIFKLLKGLKQKLIKNSQVIETKKLCGVPLKTIKGTIRNKVDQDDAWFFELAKYHEIIFDVGANVGYTALLAMIQNKNRQYVLIDPNRLALESAAKNLIMNSYGKRANYYNGFVSNAIGATMKFYTIGTGAAGSMFKSHATTAAVSNSWSHVETTTLNALVDFYNMKPDLIKIDVEGAERFVLEGASEMALNLNSTFFVEMHAIEEFSMEQNAKCILDWCKKVNYNAWYLTDGKIIIAGSEIAHRGKCHLLLLPDSKAYPSYLKGIKQNSSLPQKL